MSSRLSTGLPAMTLVKLIFSEAAVSAATVPSSDQPAGAAELGHGGEAEQGAQRVGAGVAEHRPLAEVLGQQRGGGAQRHRGQRRRHRRVTDDGGREQGPAGEQPDLDGPAGAQVEQVGQVGGPGDGGAVDQRVDRAAGDQGGGGEAGRADAEDLDGAAGDLAAARAPSGAP